MAKFVQIYDTTLRDGAQREGISYSLADKLHIVQKLDELGIRFIEGGWPGSNPKDAEFFAQAKKLKLKNAQITAFGSTRKAGTKSENDSNLKALLDTGNEGRRKDESDFRKRKKNSQKFPDAPKRKRINKDRN